MSSEWESRAAIYVDENHTYQVELGAQPEVKWKLGELSLRVHIPYDGQLPYGDNQQLKDVPEDEDQLVLGHVLLTSPQHPNSAEAIQVVIPTGKDLQTHLKSGRQLVIHRSSALSEPQDTLITVDGKVSDDTDEERLEERLKSLSIEQLDDFANKLRLQLQLSVPNMLEERRQKAAAREQREILLERESERQIPFPKIEDSKELARSLTALANTPGGGRIIIGMDKRGLIAGLVDQNGMLDNTQIEKMLLAAALGRDPPIFFFPPENFEPSTGKSIASVTVPEGRAGPYQFDGMIYRRVGAATVSKKVSVAAPIAATPDQPVVNLKEILVAGLRDNVIIRDARNIAIDALELGPYICSLINAQHPNSIIVIRNLSPSADNRNSLRQQLDARLRQELERCLPHLAPPRLEITQLGDEQIAILYLPSTLPLVALYNDQGYLWGNHDDQGRQLDKYAARLIDIHTVSTLYHERMLPGAYVEMVYGEIAWPIQPSAAIEVGSGSVYMPGNVHYDVQRQAMVWQTTQFKLEKDTNWWCCELIAPLRDALVQLNDGGKITSTAPVLTGVLLVRLDSFLASDLEITPLANSEDEDSHTTGTTSAKGWFKHLPIYRRTNLRIEMTIYTQELFKRRRRMSRLHFRVPDVHLDEERVADIRQACADLGFQIYRVNEDWLFDDVRPRAQLAGIRNKGFCDITLFAVIARSNPQELTRELRYRQRTDSKTIQASLLDIGIWLWGSGDMVAEEIASLHIGLYEILSQRLHHLRTE
ncbi:MAG: helix-turn-helix domain-containing protein [Roseiflexaceae bacterium]